MIEIKLVNDTILLKEFIDLPEAIYKAFSEFDPPLAVERRMLLNSPQSSLHQRGKVQYWLAYRGGIPVGRISAQADPVLPVGIAPGAGAFGCIDAIDDGDVIAALVAAAQAWLAGQGCDSIYGPCTLTMNDEPGLLVEGYDEPVMTLSPWHPPYLKHHLEALGFAKLQDLLFWRLALSEVSVLHTKLSRRLAERIPDLRIRHPDRSSYDDDIQLLCDVYNDGWQDHWGFVPLMPADLDGLDLLMKWLVPRQAFKIAEVAGEAVAVLLLVPNLFELKQGVGGRPSLIGWVRLAWRLITHRFRSGRIIVFGLRKQMQGTVAGSAIAALLVDNLIVDSTALRGEWVEAGWVLEDNHALNQMLEGFNFQPVKKYRIYGRAISIIK